MPAGSQQLIAESEDDNLLPNESFLQFLRRKKRYYQLILEAWSAIEFNVDQLVTRQFDLNCEYPDKKVQYLVSSPFEARLRFLKRMGAVNLEEFRLIHKFQKRRNRFFHTLGTAEMGSLSQKELEQVMDEAVEAAQLTFNILSR